MDYDLYEEEMQDRWSEGNCSGICECARLVRSDLSEEEIKEKFGEYNEYNAILKFYKDLNKYYGRRPKPLED